MSRGKTSKAWMHMHVTDPYVRQAQKDGYRSRAVYKLAEIAERDKLVRSGMSAVDLGAAPGGWSQWLIKQVGEKGRVVAIDLLPMDPIPGVAFLQADFSTDAGLDALQSQLKGAALDLVVSDMAPNLSGVASADQARIAYLAELAIAFAKVHLKPQGVFLVKVFQGEHFESLRRQMLASFKTVAVRKPKASRSESKETYLLGRILREVVKIP